MTKMRVNGKEIMNGITMTIDIRDLFGTWDWRLKLGVVLIQLGASVLRINVEFKQ